MEFKSWFLMPKRVISNLLLIFFCSSIGFVNSDSFNYNSYNNHGVVGLVNMPTARLFDESVYGATLYGGSPDTRLTFTTSPFNWLEASLYYTRIQDRPYCSQSFDPVCNQSYKDKGFNFKIRLKEEGVLPAIAIGINDLGGTGLYSSEYLVASYGINNLDLHFGLGWGSLDGSNHSFKNPLSYLSNRFENRPSTSPEDTGKISSQSFFSGNGVSPFFGLSYILNEKTILKFEHDTTYVSGQDMNFFGSPEIGYEIPKFEYSIGVDYQINNNLSLGLSHERGNYLSLKFSYKRDAVSTFKKSRYRSAKVLEEDNKYTKLIKNLENNGIGVNKISEAADTIGLELTQFIHPNMQIIKGIVREAAIDSGIEKNIKTDLRIVNLQAYKDIEREFDENAKVIYKRKKTKAFNTNTKLSFRPFLASREEFFKGALLLENNSEYIFTDNFFFSSNIKQSIADNFDDLEYPPLDTYPAQVRSDVKDYLKNFDRGIIGRAQFDGYKSLSSKDHLMFSVGIFEEMFSGYGFEYLRFKQDTNHAYGVEAFHVYKRDYDMRFGLLDYDQTTAHFNYYYRNYGLIPFDLKASTGKYLAGDLGATIELSRTFPNGVNFGIFATFTDVSSEDFGEGSFDKGIFFNVPIFSNMISYTWRPLTKDPGAKLIRKNNLHDLLVKFSPIYWLMF